MVEQLVSALLNFSDNSAQYIYETEPFCWKTQIDSLSIKNLDLLVMNMIFILTQCIYSVFVIKLIVHLIAIYWHSNSTSAQACFIG